MQLLSVISRVIDRLNRWIGRATSWFILASVLITAGNATVRKIFDDSSNAWLEIQWYLYGAAFLLAAGYVLRLRERGWYEHRLLNGLDPAVNLHVFTLGAEEVERMLAFRDLLRRDPSALLQYERTKRELAAQAWQHTQDYADAKSAVVEELVARALAERSRPTRLG